MDAAAVIVVSRLSLVLLWYHLVIGLISGADMLPIGSGISVILVVVIFCYIILQLIRVL